MSTIRTALDNARDPLEAIRALDARLPLAMQRVDDDLLAAVGSDLARRWHRDREGEGSYGRRPSRNPHGVCGCAMCRTRGGVSR